MSWKIGTDALVMPFSSFQKSQKVRSHVSCLQQMCTHRQIVNGPLANQNTFLCLYDSLLLVFSSDHFLSFFAFQLTIGTILWCKWLHQQLTKYISLQ